MKFAKVLILMAGCMAIAGCQDNALLQCQQEREKLQKDLLLSEQKLAEEQKIIDETIAVLMDEDLKNLGLIKTLEAQVKQLTEEKGKLQKQIAELESK